jgi:phosphatidylethanolamine/phosphatidyl-N-methylethanolamine N-methyltransferase
MNMEPMRSGETPPAGKPRSARVAAQNEARMNEGAVRTAYRRWAPVYDNTFGWVASEARRHAVDFINTRSGRVLEVGVGTGLSLPSYRHDLEIVGIDLSPEMLEKARERVAALGLANVTGLHEMDAGKLEFPDGSFDIVAAMFVMTVVPEPEKVMRELARVCRPGGEVLIVNHFSTEAGFRGWVERRMAPFGDKLGWRPVFDQQRVMVCDDLELIERHRLRPMGLFTMLRFRKAGGEAA